MMENKILDRFGHLLEESLKDTSAVGKSFSLQEEGVVVDVNNYIIIAKGFSKIAYEECVIINNEYRGIVEVIENDIVKIILLDKTENICVGDKVRRTFSSLTVPVGDALIGRVVDGLGKPLDNKGKLDVYEYYKVERPATPIINRKSVSEPVQTGIKAIDSLIPIGRGQRELILGDRQTGKTSIAIDTILNQKNGDMICIYCSIGQRDSSIANLLKVLEDNEAMKYTIVVHASSNEIVGQQFIAPYAATSIAEYFMQKGKHVLIVYDDLSKQAKAYREISLLLEKNPGREAYPADIFYIHSRLLERSTKMKDELGGGSITSLPIIETEAENISAYIPTNVISITDGQIYLSPSMFQKGLLPAIDIGKSVSRVGSSAQLPAYKQAVGILGIEFSQFEELESFSKLATTMDETSENIIKKGEIIREIFKQPNGSTLKAHEQIAVLLCLNNNIFKTIGDVAKIQSIAIETMKTDFPNIVEIIYKKEKIPQDLINLFITKVSSKLSE